MVESKLQKAQVLLHVIYDFQTDLPIKEIESILEAHKSEGRKAEEKHFGTALESSHSFGGFPSSFGYEEARGEALAQAAQQAGISEKDFTTIGNWLLKRGLIKRPDWTGLNSFSLTTVGEDLIDLGISIEEWYHGPYRERLLNRAQIDTNSEDDD